MEKKKTSLMMTPRLYPLFLSAAIIILDQISKALIIRHIPIYTVGASFWDGILRIVHTRNLAIAFSLGNSLPPQAKFVLFKILPALLLLGLVIYAIKSDEFTRLQRWAVAAIIGGGLGNLLDRIFRPQGVVDFIDVKFYGLFGLDRWPTFNVADSSIVIGGILLLLSFILEKGGTHE